MIKREKSRGKPQVIPKISKIIIGTSGNTVLAELNSKNYHSKVVSSSAVLSAVLAGILLSNYENSNNGDLEIFPLNLFSRQVSI